jgi:hypothetical protein
MRRLAFLIIFTCAFWVKPGWAAPPNSTVGAYRLIFRGCFSGTGNGVVTPNSVMVRGKLFDENGNRINFVAPNLTLENGRFHDVVSVAGMTVKITGRVDPGGGSLRKARLVCTFSVAGTRFGRVAGEHQ